MFRVRELRENVVFIIRKRVIVHSIQGRKFLNNL